LNEPRERYTTPGAFRSALNDRLGAAAMNGPWTLHELQRQFAYDRLLLRLYAIDDGWVLKGATALLARRLGVRATTDIDLFRRATSVEAEREVRRAAMVDLGDWFTFDVGSASAVADGIQGIRLPVTAALGTTTWSTFHLDIVGSGVEMTGSVESVQELTANMTTIKASTPFLVYPLVDHIADKIAALYQRFGPSKRPSTRFKDLVDLVAIVNRVTVVALDQERALISEFNRRNLEIPENFTVPDRDLWLRGFSREASRAHLGYALDLESAIRIVGLFVNPLFGSTAEGVWHPSQLRWKPEESH
jgi:hypothetical protein